jgi:hypothetical protein
MGWYNNGTSEPGLPLMKKAFLWALIFTAVLAAVGYFDLQKPEPQEPTPAPESSKPIEKPPQPESKEHIKGVLTELQATNPEMRFGALASAATIYTPYGPCGSVSHLAPGQFGFNSGREDDRTILLYPNQETALRAAWKYCDGWYTQEKANRSAARQITGQ